MFCRRIDLPGGAAIVCGRGERPKLCATCKHRPATKLCDFKLAGRKAGKTCDGKLCEVCAVGGGEDVDYCPPHARAVEARGGLKAQLRVYDSIRVGDDWVEIGGDRTAQAIAWLAAGRRKRAEDVAERLLQIARDGEGYHKGDSFVRMPNWRIRGARIVDGDEVLAEVGEGLPQREAVAVELPGVDQ